MIKYLSIIIIFNYTICNFLASSKVKASDDTYFVCKNGFRFENKENAVRCIRQAKISYRLLQDCNLSAKKDKYTLVIDRFDHNDSCILNEEQIMGSEKTQENGQSKNSFQPTCQIGFTLKVRRGEDACSMVLPEEVLAPSKKVSRSNSLSSD